MDNNFVLRGLSWALDEAFLQSFFGAHIEFLEGAKGNCEDCTGPDCEGCSKLPEGMTKGPGAR